MTNYTESIRTARNDIIPYIVSDNTTEAREYAESLGIIKIRKVGECPCGCGLNRYSILEYGVKD